MISNLISRILSGAFIVLIISMGLGVITIGNVAGGNLRLWQFCLIVYLIFLIIRKTIVIEAGVGVSLSLLPAVGYYLAVVLSGLNAIDHDLWLRRVILNSTFLLLFITVNLGFRSINAALVSKSVIISGVVFGALGVIDAHFYHVNDILFEYIHMFDSSNSDGVMTLGYYGDIPRVRGFASEANEFSQYLIIPFGFIIASLAFTHRSKFTAMFLTAGMAIIISAQLASISRGGLLGFSVQVIFLYIIKYKHIIKYGSLNSLVISIFSIILAGTAITLFGVNYFGENLLSVVFDRILTTNTLDDWSAGERLATISAGIVSGGISIENFLVGVGAGNMDVSTVMQATTTNLFVDVFVETGIVGLFCFLGFISSLLFKAAKFIAVNHSHLDSSESTLFLGCSLSFVGLLFGGLTYSTHALFFFWLISGLLTSLSQYRWVRN